MKIRRSSNFSRARARALVRVWLLFAVISALALPAGCDSKSSSGGGTAGVAAGDATPEQLWVRIDELSAQIAGSESDPSLYFQRGKLRHALALCSPPAERVEFDEAAVDDLQRADELTEGGMAPALLEAGRIRMRAYRFDEGFELIREAQRIAPDDHEVRVAVAMMRGYASGEWTQALAELKSLAALPAAERSAETWFALGRAHQEKRQHADAEAAFRRCLELDANHRAARVDLALSIGELGRTEEATRLLADVRQANENDLFAGNNLAVSLIQEKKYQQAVDVLHGVLDIAPGFPAAWLNLGNALAGLGRTEEAIDAYQKAIALVPSYSAAYENLAMQFRKARRYDESIATDKKALEVDPNSTQALFGLGLAYLEDGKPAEAVEWLQKLVAIAPRNDGGWNNLASAQAAVGKLEEARTSWLQCLRVNPRNFRALRNLADGELSRGLKAEAAEHYAAFLELEPTNLTVLAKMCDALVDLGRGSEAVRRIDRIIEQVQQPGGQLLRRAEVRCSLEEFDEAISDASRAIELGTGWWAYLTRGLVQWRAGRVDAALADLEQAASLAPDDPGPAVFLSVVYAGTGQPEQARKAAKRALPSQKPDEWWTTILRFCAGELSEDELIDAAGDNVNRQCEARYYAGEHALVQGERAKAMEYFQRCVDTAVTEYVEYGLARWRLRTAGEAHQ